MSLAMDGLYKEARSLDAQRKKQYWQMMKRMHGGTDEAVAAIKQTGDDGIWHGTFDKYVEGIRNEGLLQGQGEHLRFGEGQHFGPKRIAEEYGDKLIRFKKPSELQGTDIKYPGIQSAVRLDTENPATKDLVKAELWAKHRKEIREFLDNETGEAPKNITDMFERFDESMDKFIAMNKADIETRGKLKGARELYNDQGGPEQFHFRHTKTISPNLLNFEEAQGLSTRKENRFDKNVWERNEVPTEPIVQDTVESNKSFNPYIIGGGIGLAGLAGLGGYGLYKHRQRNRESEEGA